MRGKKVIISLLSAGVFLTGCCSCKELRLAPQDKNLLRNSQATCQRALDEIQSMEKLRNDLTALLQQNRAMRNSLSRDFLRIKKVARRARVANEKFFVLDKKIKSIEEELKQLKEQISDVRTEEEKERKKLSKKLGSVRYGLYKIRKRIRNIEKSRGSKDEKLEKIEKELEKLQKEIDSLKKNLQERVNELVKCCNVIKCCTEIKEKGK